MTFGEQFHTVVGHYQEGLLTRDELKSALVDLLVRCFQETGRRISTRDLTHAHMIAYSPALRITALT